MPLKVRSAPGAATKKEKKKEVTNVTMEEVESGRHGFNRHCVDCWLALFLIESSDW